MSKNRKKSNLLRKPIVDGRNNEFNLESGGGSTVTGIGNQFIEQPSGEVVSDLRKTLRNKNGSKLIGFKGKKQRIEQLNDILRRS